MSRYIIITSIEVCTNVLCRRKHIITKIALVKEDGSRSQSISSQENKSNSEYRVVVILNSLNSGSKPANHVIRDHSHIFCISSTPGTFINFGMFKTQSTSNHLTSYFTAWARPDFLFVLLIVSV